MNTFSEKIHLELIRPTEEHPVPDRLQLLEALKNQGYAPAQLSLRALQMLHPACLAGDYRITASLARQEEGWRITTVEAGDTRPAHYGLAVDYGSTTIVMQLIDMNSGAEIARSSLPNGQRAYGTDILSRITYAMEDADHIEDLHRATAETFNRLLESIREESGIDASALPAMILSGNTAMIHFLLKLDGWTVFAAPYAPVAQNPGFFSGRELGFDFDGTVYIIPAASNYIGGDIISGLLTLDFHKKDGLGSGSIKQYHIVFGEAA